MAIQWCTNFQFTAPLDANSVAITPNGTANAYSNWVEIFVADADCVLTGVLMDAPATAQPYVVQVGVSVGGGAETVIATIPNQGVSATNIGDGVMPIRIPIDAIPNGASVRVRFAKPGTNVSDWTFALTYYKKPIVGTILTTTQPQLVTTVLPATTIALGAVAAWTNSSWTTIFTPSADSVITGYYVGFMGNGEDYILELGVASTVIWATKERNGLADYSLYFVLEHPLHVSAGAAVQGRFRKLANFARSLPIALTYVELPL